MLKYPVPRPVPLNLGCVAGWIQSFPLRQTTFIFSNIHRNTKYDTFCHFVFNNIHRHTFIFGCFCEGLTIFDPKNGSGCSVLPREHRPVERAVLGGAVARGKEVA